MWVSWGVEKTGVFTCSSIVQSRKMWDLNLKSKFCVHINIKIQKTLFYQQFTRLETVLLKSVICYQSQTFHITSVAWRNTGTCPTRWRWWLFRMFFSVPHLSHTGCVRPGFCHCRQDTKTSSTRHKKSHYCDQEMMRQVSHWHMHADTWGVLSTTSGLHLLNLVNSRKILKYK
jgi:hypothetical protein